MTVCHRHFQVTTRGKLLAISVKVKLHLRSSVEALLALPGPS